MRVRWRGVGRAAAIVVVGLLALRLAPGLLRAPEPPPLGADVGLPRAKPAPTAPTKKARLATKPSPERHRRRLHRPENRGRPSPSPQEPAAETAPAPIAESVESPAPSAPEYVPPPAPEPSPAPPPGPSPASSSTPGDGSEEFAPH